MALQAREREARPARVAKILAAAYDGRTGRLDLTNTFDNAIWNKLRGRLNAFLFFFRELGTIMSGVVGILIIVKLFTNVISHIVNCHILYKVGGCGSHMVRGLCTSLTTAFLQH